MSNKTILNQIFNENIQQKENMLVQKVNSITYLV